MDCSYYMTVSELIKVGFGRDRARALIHLVRDELEEQGIFLPNGLKAPRKAVLKKMGVEDDLFCTSPGATERLVPQS